MQSLNEINVAIMLLDIRWNGITSFTSFTSASTPTGEGSLKVRRDRGRERGRGSVREGSLKVRRDRGRERGRDSVREGSLKVRRELCVVCCVLCAVCCMLFTLTHTSAFFPVLPLLRRREKSLRSPPRNCSFTLSLQTLGRAAMIAAPRRRTGPQQGSRALCSGSAAATTLPGCT